MSGRDKYPPFDSSRPSFLSRFPSLVSYGNALRFEYRDHSQTHEYERSPSPRSRCQSSDQGRQRRSRSSEWPPAISKAALPPKPLFETVYQSESSLLRPRNRTIPVVEAKYTGRRSSSPECGELQLGSEQTPHANGVRGSSTAICKTTSTPHRSMEDAGVRKVDNVAESPMKEIDMEISRSSSPVGVGNVSISARNRTPSKYQESGAVLAVLSEQPSTQGPKTIVLSDLTEQNIPSSSSAITSLKANVETGKQAKILEETKRLMAPIILRNALRRDPSADESRIKRKLDALLTEEHCQEFVRLAKETQAQMAAAGMTSKDLNSISINDQREDVRRQPSEGIALIQSSPSSRTQPPRRPLTPSAPAAMKPRSRSITSPVASHGLPPSTPRMPRAMLQALPPSPFAMNAVASRKTTTPPVSGVVPSTGTVAEGPQSIAASSRVAGYLSRNSVEVHSHTPTTDRSTPEGGMFVTQGSRVDSLGDEDVGSSAPSSTLRKPRDNNGPAVQDSITADEHNDRGQIQVESAQTTCEDATDVTSDAAKFIPSRLSPPDAPSLEARRNVEERIPGSDIQSDDVQMADASSAEPSVSDAVNGADGIVKSTLPAEEQMAAIAVKQPSLATGNSDKTLVQSIRSVTSEPPTTTLKLPNNDREKGMFPSDLNLLNPTTSPSRSAEVGPTGQVDLPLDTSPVDETISETPREAISDPTPACVVPGLWLVFPGKPHSDIVSFKFTVDDEAASAVERWSRRYTEFDISAGHVKVELICLPLERVTEINRLLGPSTPLNEVLEGLRTIAIEWPTPGQLVVELRTASGEEKIWLSDDLDNGPLDISAHIRPGVHIARFVQLSDLSNKLFVLLACAPSTEEKDRFVARSQDRGLWNSFVKRTIEQTLLSSGIKVTSRAVTLD